MINIAPEMRSEPRAWENRQVVSGYSSERGRWREEKPEKYRAGEKVREAQSVGEVIGGVGEGRQCGFLDPTVLRPVAQGQTVEAGPRER